MRVGAGRLGESVKDDMDESIHKNKFKSNDELTLSVEHDMVIFSMQQVLVFWSTRLNLVNSFRFDLCHVTFIEVSSDDALRLTTGRGTVNIFQLIL